MKKENFIEIKDFENYLISDLGNVFSKQANKILKNNINTSGYYFVNLYKDKKPHVKMIHKLVYESFNLKKSNRNFVIDHINNNKLDNNLNNLQLITNRLNSSKDKKNKSGHFCIYKNNKSWIVRMRLNNKKISIGTFKNIEDAIIKRDEFINSIKN